jgi:hypothetical protein
MMRLLWVSLLAGTLAACTQQQLANRVDPSSFRVELLCTGKSAADCPVIPKNADVCPASPAPARTGSPASPVDRTDLYYMAQVTAIGNDGSPYAGYNATANVYSMFDGSVSPRRSPLNPPLGTLPFTAGKACLGVTIPPAFDATFIWVEDPVQVVSDTAPGRAGHRFYQSSFAIGSSAPIYRPAPLISDVVTTTDMLNTRSPLEGKHVLLAGGSPVPNPDTSAGAPKTVAAPLVVTSVSAKYFTVTDIGTPGGDNAWGSLEIYSYSQPVGIHVGSTVRNINGTLNAFKGLNELNFPIWDVVSAAPDPVNAPLPTPHEIKVTDIPNVLAGMKPWESGLVEVKGWQVCALAGRDLASYQKYSQWKLAPPSVDCTAATSSLSIITNTTVPSFNPLNNVGKKICALTGILAHVIPVAGIHLWEVYPRSAADLGTPIDPSMACP